MNDGTWRRQIEAVEKERDENAKARDEALETLQEWRSKAKSLEQHVSELERSLENARKARDSADVDFAALTQALASGLDLPKCRSVGGITIADAIGSLRKERDEQRQRAERAEADNAAKDKALAPMVEQVRAVFEIHHAPSHCALGLNLLVSHGEAILAASQSHPGAALLEEHRKAMEKAKGDLTVALSTIRQAFAEVGETCSSEGGLVGIMNGIGRSQRRARNEGLETARTMVFNVGFHNLASLIEAAKESEQ